AVFAGENAEPEVPQGTVAEDQVEGPDQAATDDVRSATFLGLPVSDLIVLSAIVVLMVAFAIFVQIRRRPARPGE
ncbi:MAG TPA: hypothetical protein PK890_11895, partial [Terrimesophilobacter sp.]|nr:hypothetical protein [Terrimesophilobacter sp.]